MRYHYDVNRGVTHLKTKVTLAIMAFGLLFGSAAVPLSLLGSASATTPPTVTNTVITPSSTVFDSNNVNGVQGDYAPGFSSGSLASNGTAKTDMYFTPTALFGHPVNLGDIASMSYWTKTGSTHAVDPSDWFLAIYTNPYSGDVSTSWYGDRIGTEPYFSKNIDDPANTWNQWSTGGTSNQLRFFESTAGAPGATFGSYTDPTWNELVSGNALSGQPYSGHSVMSFSVQTGSAWANGFTGRVDGLTITLNDGSVANVNFEATSLTAPSLIAPTNNSVVNGASLTSDWSDVVGADHYIYESYNDSALSSLRYTNTYTQSQKTATNVADATFWWRVSAVDGSGSQGPWSSVFKVTIDNEAPVVAITNPLDGTVVSGTVDVRGTVTDAHPDHYYAVVNNSSNVQVAGPGVVNDTSSFTDQHLFNFNTTLVQDGVYTIRLEARDQAGNKDTSSSVDVVTVTVNNTPDNANQCKNGVWASFTKPAFKNQGECVSWVQHHLLGNGVPSIKP